MPRQKINWYLECTRGNHNKFYAIEVKDSPDGRYDLFTNWGRIGQSGTRRQIFTSVPRTTAQKEALRIFRNKLAKGYVDKTGQKRPPVKKKGTKKKSEEEDVFLDRFSQII